MVKFLLFLYLLFAVNANAELIQRSKVLMGTFASISVDAQHKELIKPSFEIIRNVENSLSSYKETSPIFKLNKNKKALLDEYSYEALRASLEYYKQTNGYFNIAIGTITKVLYRFGANERMSSKKALKNALISINALFFTKERAFIKEGIKIDLGGMGKGFGVDKVIEFLKKKDIREAVVALSGDIRCINSCKIAINNPLNKESVLLTCTVKNMGISTSGNYNRYVNNTKYNHLINPKTKSSEQNFKSVTLISKLPNADLDAYTTAVSVMPKRKAYEFLQSLHVAYIILDAQNNLTVSENINDYVDDLFINYTFKEQPKSRKH